MSASLVGSEMCIRDRSSGTFHVWMRGGREKSPTGSTKDPCPEHRGFLACLLYTSDAADDM
eukprot:140437-Alexandrium_andersonii.AAC.1